MTTKSERAINESPAESLHREAIEPPRSRTMDPMLTILAAALLALLPSCFTASVWGAPIPQGDGGAPLQINDGEPISQRVWVKLILTPLAVVLDLCTAPVQVVLFGWDDDDDC